MFELMEELIKSIKEKQPSADLFTKIYDYFKVATGPDEEKETAVITKATKQLAIDLAASTAFEQKDVSVSDCVTQVSALFAISDTSALSKLSAEQLQIFLLILACLPGTAALLPRLVNDFKVDPQFLNNDKPTALDVAVAYQQAENVEKLLELLWDREVANLKRERRVIKSAEIRQALWLKFINFIAAKSSQQRVLKIDITIFDLYVARFGCPNISIVESLDDYDELCTVICISPNLLMPHLLNMFFSQPQLGDQPAAPICLCYLQRAVAKHKPELVERLFYLYSRYQPNVTDAEQKQIWGQLIPVMRAYSDPKLDTPQKKQDEQIFNFFVLRWGTAMVEGVLTKRFLGQSQLRTYLGSLIQTQTAKKDIFQLLLLSDAAEKDKGNLIAPLLVLIIDYLIYLPFTDIVSNLGQLPEKNSKKNKQLAIPARLSAINHEVPASDGLDSIIPSLPSAVSKNNLVP